MTFRCKKNKYFVSGYYGFKNFGDDLFPFAIQKLFKESGLDKDADFYFCAPFRGELSQYSIAPDLVSSIYQLKKKGRLVRLFYFILAMCRADVFILAGGSTISTGTSQTMRKIELLFARLRKLPLRAVGVSVGPFSDTKDLGFYKRYINQLEYLAVRDCESARWVRELAPSADFVEAGDLVGLLRSEIQNVESKKISCDKLAIGVGLCNFKNSSGKGYEERDALNEKIIETLLRHEHLSLSKIRVLSLNGNPDNGDDEISKKFCRRLKTLGLDAEYFPYTGPWETVSLVKSLDVFLVQRLHGGIVSYLSGIPFFLFPYKKKCTDFLKDINYPKKYFLDSISDANTLTSSLSRFLSDPNRMLPGISPLDYEKKSRKIKIQC